MSYAIVGFGKIGQALAKAFGRAGIEVAVAATRAPQELAPTAHAIGPAVQPSDLAEALEAEVILLAIPFQAHGEVASQRPDWSGKIIIDVTNAYGVDPSDLADRPSSSVVAASFRGANVVKAFNHLPASTLAQDPTVNGGRRVIFLASDSEDAAADVGSLVEKLGYWPLYLGKLTEGGTLVQAKGGSWAHLIFQDLVKFG